MMASTINAGSRLPGFIPGSTLISYMIVDILLNFPCPSLLICKMGIITVPSSSDFKEIMHIENSVPNIF